MLFTLGLFLVIGIYSKVTRAESSDIPEQAQQTGYTVSTFSSTFTDDIDFQNTRQAGYKWYLEDFYGQPSANPEDFEFMPDGALVINSGIQGEIATATRYRPGKASRQWVGAAFGGGGYFEAEIKFDSAAVLKQPRKEGWPAFWAMSIEHRAGLPEEQWIGQDKGFVHFIEVDIMEYLYKGFYAIGKYGTNLHLWYGQYLKTCSEGAFCKVSLPYLDRAAKVSDSTDFNQFHKYGFLWVPATGEKKGFAQFYFDNHPVGKKVTWPQFAKQEPSAKLWPWTYALLDRQHLILLLGTGNGLPMTVRAVNVWQKSTQDNLISQPQ